MVIDMAVDMMSTTNKVFLFASTLDCFRQIIRKIEKMIGSKRYFLKYNYCFTTNL